MSVLFGGCKPAGVCLTTGAPPVEALQVRGLSSVALVVNCWAHNVADATVAVAIQRMTIGEGPCRPSRGGWQGTDGGWRGLWRYALAVAG